MFAVGDVGFCYVVWVVIMQRSQKMQSIYLLLLLFEGASSFEGILSFGFHQKGLSSPVMYFHSQEVPLIQSFASCSGSLNTVLTYLQSRSNQSFPCQLKPIDQIKGPVIASL